MKIPAPEQLPSGSWRIRLSFKGKRYSITASTRRECQENARYRMKALQAEESLPKCEKTLTEAIDAFIAERDAIISPSTLAAYRSYQRNHFLSVMDTPISKIKNWQVLINEEAKRISPKTLKNVWSLVESSVSAQGVRMPKVRLTEVQVNEIPYFAPDELQAFLAAIRGSKYEVPFLLGLHSLRLSEISAIRQGDITGDTIHVRGARVRGTEGFVLKDENKTVKSRRDIPILIPRLEELLADMNWSIMECNPETYRKNLYRICRKAGIKVVSMQGLRHSFRTLCHYLRISEIDCMRYGGWSDINVMHRHYTHLTELERKESTAKLRDFFTDASAV